MWPPFNPHAKLMRELSRRAKKLLEAHGVETIPSRGSVKPGSRAVLGRVFVYVGDLPEHLSVRYRSLEKSGKPYELVYRERICDGEVIARFVGLLEPTVKALRQLQILDDLAGI